MSHSREVYQVVQARHDEAVDLGQGSHGPARLVPEGIRAYTAIPFRSNINDIADGWGVEYRCLNAGVHWREAYQDCARLELAEGLGGC